MYAPKLQPLSAQERWLMGFHHRIDTKADAYIAEIRAMVAEAKKRFEPPKPKPVSAENDMMRALQSMPLRGYDDLLQSLGWAQRMAQQQAMSSVVLHPGLSSAFGNGWLR